MNLDSMIENIEVRDTGKCSNCNKETCYYDITTNQYVCSKGCYDILNELNTNKLEIAMDGISDAIDKSFTRRVSFGKDVRNGLKFLGESMMLLPKEIISHFRDKDNK